MNFFPAIGIAALAAGFYHASGGASFQAPEVQAPVVRSVPAAPDASSAAAPADQIAATPERVAAVQAAFVPGPETEETAENADGPGTVRIRRGNEVEAVRVRRVTAAVRAPQSTPDADAAFERIFAAAARGEVLPVADAPRAAAGEPTTFDVVNVAAPGAVIDALDGVLDLREVIGDSVNMRGGPGVAYPVVGTLARGTQAEVVREDGGWAELRLASGETGWMAANFLR